MDELTMFIIVATAYMVLTVDIHFVVILLAYFVSSLPFLFCYSGGLTSGGKFVTLLTLLTVMCSTDISRG